MKSIRTYAEFTSHFGNTSRLRTIFRDAAILALSVGRNISSSSNWIRFPYYHHVFDDERYGFTRQLNYLRDFGEFFANYFPLMVPFFPLWVPFFIWFYVSFCVDLWPNIVDWLPRNLSIF